MKNIFNNISLTRLSGITNFICVDVHPGHISCTGIKRKESFFLIKKKPLLNYEVIFTELHYKGNELNIKKLLKDLCDKYKLHKPAIILSINEYRSTLISIPVETDDEESWFEENKQKFLPENLNQDDFVYSFEKFREDENFKQYLLVIARNDYLEKIIKSCKETGLTLLGIFPFHFTVLSYFRESEQNMLYIDLCGNNLFYASRSETGNILYNSFFFDLYKSDNEEDSGSSQLNTENLKFCLEEIKQSLLLTGSNNVLNLSVYASFPAIHIEKITNSIKQIFSIEELNTGFKQIDPFYLTSLQAVNNVTNDLDYKLNLFKNPLLAAQRTKIEKDLALRLTLAAGFMLLMFLFITYFAESILNRNLSSGEEAFAEMKARLLRIEKLKADNVQMKSNLDLLSRLKYSKSQQSLLLAQISNLINSRSCLTELRVHNKNNNCLIELSGISHSQQDVAEFLANMEKTKTFNEISLLYSSDNQPEQSKSEETNSSGKVKFKIKSGYNAGKN